MCLLAFSTPVGFAYCTLSFLLQSVFKHNHGASTWNSTVENNRALGQLLGSVIPEV